MGYNGWKNWETWNINLWIDNEEGMYWARRYLVEHCNGGVTVDDTQAFCENLFPNGTPDMDPEDMGNVDYAELAAAWEAERDEEAA